MGGCRRRRFAGEGPCPPDQDGESGGGDHDDYHDYRSQQRYQIKSNLMLNISLMNAQCSYLLLLFTCVGLRSIGLCLFPARKGKFIDQLSSQWSAGVEEFSKLESSKMVLLYVKNSRKRKNLHKHLKLQKMTIQSLVLQSIQARKLGLQAPSNLAGSKIKNTHFLPLSILSQRYDIQYMEKQPPC